MTCGLWKLRRTVSLASRRAATPSSPAASCSSVGSTEAGDTGVPTKSRRRRHRFGGGGADEIPSFRDFQQQSQVRSLYRQFARLVYNSSTTAGAPELQSQIRREFRLAQPDSWHIQRALSEGGRRYKELSAMLGNSVIVPGRTERPSTNTPASRAAVQVPAPPPASTTSEWPWNQPPGAGTRQRPTQFPPKSNL